MKRRVLLKRMGALGGAGAVAGCLGEGGSPGGGGDEDGGAGGDGDDTPTATATETPTATPTEEPTPTVANEAIETEETDCTSEEQQQASVSFESETVVVDGAIQSPDPCHEATLETVEYAPDADRLTVGVGLKDEEGACESCLGIVKYRAEIGFDAALPGHVTVEHVGSDGEATTVAEASE
ncbi:MAG: hypothetical protein ACOCS7_02245 [Halolamina sp.]